MLVTTAPTTRRELSKAERRSRIVEAAASLLRESGFDSVSMLQIAERADVSPATVYNLFLSKAAVFQHVFDRDLSEYERLVEAAPARDALDRIFKAIDVAATLYRQDPGFYRAMAQVQLQPGARIRPSASLRIDSHAGWRGRSAGGGRYRPGNRRARPGGVTLTCRSCAALRRMGWRGDLGRAVGRGSKLRVRSRAARLLRGG